MLRTIPLMHKGRLVGSAEVEVDQRGARVVSTSITDPEIKKKFEDDLLRLSVPPPEKEEG